MAFDTKQVYYTGSAADLLPTGHSEETTPASIGTSDIGAQHVVIDDIAADDVANATKTTAIAAITTQVTSKIDTLVGTTMGVDTTSNTVSYNFNVTNINRGVVANDILYTDAANVFVVKGILNVAVS